MKLADITTEDITTLVGLLTKVQKDELVGVYYSADSIYNPIQSTSNPDTMWVKDLELIEYKAKPTPSPF